MNAISLLLQCMVLLLFAIGAATLVAMVKGCLVLRRQARGTPGFDTNIILKSPLVPAISVITTCSDFAPESFAFVRKLIELHYGKHELVLVLDGSNEESLEAWTKEFRLCPSMRNPSTDLPSKPIRGIYESRDPLRLVVVDKVPGGVADSLNAGVNVSASPVIALLDPDSDFDPPILLYMVRPMLDDPTRTLAVCGVMPVAGETIWRPEGTPDPDASRRVSRLGELEALRIWLSRGAAFAGWNRLVPVPGSSLLVTRESIVQQGGFRGGPLELFLNLHGKARAAKRDYRVAFVPERVSCLRPPKSTADLKARIYRDEQAFVAAIGHRKSIAGGIGAIGLGLPAIFTVRFVRPFLETLIYPLTIVGLFLGFVDLPLAGLVLLSTVAMGMLVSMAAVVLRELVEFRGSDPERLASLFFTAVPENLGYRQIRNLWLIAGFFSDPQKQKAAGERE